MLTLKEYLQQAAEEKKAIGHFNISNWEGIKALTEVCQESGAPIIMGVSQGEAGFIGISEIAEIVADIRRNKNIPLFLNADHFKDMDKVELAAKAGFDSILFDAATDNLMDNIGKTRRAVELIKSINKEILTEGELGYIGVGSEVRENVPAGAVITEEQMITVEQAREFTEKTGVNMIGPAVGNIHGIVKGYTEKLNFKRIKQLREGVNAYLVLHGASGIDDKSLKKAVASGMSVVHVNTELRLAWKNALEKYMQDNPSVVAPYKILEPAVEELKKVIKHKLEVFGWVNESNS